MAGKRNSSGRASLAPLSFSIWRPRSGAVGVLLASAGPQISPNVAHGNHHWFRLDGSHSQLAAGLRPALTAILAPAFPQTSSRKRSALLSDPSKLIGLIWMATSSITLKVIDAWVPATDKVGADLPLLRLCATKPMPRMPFCASDALLRISPKGIRLIAAKAPAMRMISSIPLVRGGTTVLRPDGCHVMLLQTRQPLAVGERFTCLIAFQNTGTIKTEVNVRNASLKQRNSKTV